MPNWCDNTITIQGSTETVKTLWDEASAMDSKGSGGLLEAMHPIGAWDYGTAVEEWGTKWDVDLEGLEFTDNGDGTSSITGWASSAWAPPINAFSKFSDSMDGVYCELKYYEPGMDFIGVWDSEGGDAYWENIAEMVAKGEHEQDTVLAELVEDFGVEPLEEEEMA